MKKYVILFVIMLITATLAGQNRNSNNSAESKIAHPRFLGNEIFVNGELKRESLNDYLKKNVKYPKKSAQCYEQGTEVVEFVVTAAGEPKAFRVVNSVCQRMDKEVIRAIKNTRGKWVPGTVNGKPADTKQEVSVVFTVVSYKQYMKKVQNLARKGNHLLFVLNKPKKALKYFNYAIKLMPHDESLLAGRSLCRYSTGDLYGAESDWERLKVLTQRTSNMNGIIGIADKASKLKGYEEMMTAINWKQQEMADKH